MLQQAANGLRTNPDSKAWPPIIQTIENSRDNSATEVLAQFIEHDQDQISIQCALALSRKTMHQDQRAIPGLQRALKTSVERNQLEASIDALGKIGGDDAIQCLIEVYDELKTIHTVDERIARILHHSNNPLAMDVFRAILRYLGNGNNRKVAGIAALALGKLKDKSVLPDLVTIIKNPKEYEPTRINAIEAIGELGDATAVPDLIQELNKFPRTLDYKFAEPIVKALARIGSDDAINYLEQRRRAHDPNNWLGRVIKANLPTG